MAWKLVLYIYIFINLLANCLVFFSDKYLFLFIVSSVFFLCLFFYSFLVRRLDIALYLLLACLGTDLLEVNFLTVQGAVTAELYSRHVSLSSLNVPFLGFSVVFLFLFFVILFSLARSRLRVGRDVVLLGMAFFAVILCRFLFNDLSFFFSDFKKICFIILGVFLGRELVSLKDFKLVLSVAVVLSVLVLGGAYCFDVKRIYAGEYVALAVGVHSYIFFLPYVFNVGFLFRLFLLVSVFVVYSSMGFLVSGKTFVFAMLALFLLLMEYPRNGGRQGSCLVWFLWGGAIVGLLSLFFVNISSLVELLFLLDMNIAGHKLKQLDFVNNYNALDYATFFNSSGGNMLAEFVTVHYSSFVGGLSSLSFLGMGPGAVVADYFGVLSLANKDAYSEVSFYSNSFRGFHVAYLNFISWFGLFSIFAILNVFRKSMVYGCDRWVLYLFCLGLFLATGNKFDAIIFGVVIYVMFNYEKFKNNF